MFVSVADLIALMTTVQLKKKGTTHTMTYTFKDFVCPTTANRKGIAALCVTSTKASK